MILWILLPFGFKVYEVMKKKTNKNCKQMKFLNNSLPT